MAKGYWLPQIDVSNMEGYKAYMAATPPAHEKYHGTALVRGGRSEVVEGRMRSRCVIREFPDYTAALACYRSDEYQQARVLRLPHSQCDFVVAEGFDDPQPPRPAAGSAAKKGYWIVHLDVTDAEAYKAYPPALLAHLAKFGTRFLVRGGAREVPEGEVRGRTAVVEFPSFDAALACYRSPDYVPVRKLRQGNAEVDLVIVEGYDGPKF
ncbi:MAG: DUF1330 domain-containing protein [Xanthobacteraceae bacterium]